jgi:FkbM family methyltransferase
VGNHAVFFAAELGLETTAIEPNPDNFRCLTQNVEANGVAGRCRLVHAAIGASPGRGRSIPAQPDNSGMARMLADEGGEIEVTTLDRLIPEGAPVDLLKIDVEGWELQVLEGAGRILRTGRPLLYIEVSEGAYPAVSRFLTALSYVGWRRFNSTPTILFLPRERFGGS